MKNNNKKVTHILCDLSDVLIKGIEGIELSLSKKVGLPVEKVKEVLFSYDFRPIWLGLLDEDAFVGKLIKDTGWTLSVGTFKEIIRNNFFEIDGVREIYLELRKKYTLILFSVNAREWVKYLDSNFKYVHLFDEVLYSYDIGYTKREPESFKFIINKFRLDPGCVILIDDSGRNILVSESVGIKGIKFINSEILKATLGNLNIL
ncbi:MAG: HAD hydrolase-like protein [bacterium]